MSAFYAEQRADQILGRQLRFRQAECYTVGKNTPVAATIENAFIYLLGFAGTGKLTIGLELQRLVPAILVDNHLINNVVFGLIDVDGKTALPPEVFENTGAVRKIALDTIRRLSRPRRNFIFTNELIEGDPIDRQWFEDVAEVAAARGAALLTVRLLISPDELARRVNSPERRIKLKATDGAAARERALTQKVLRPTECFELDVTRLSATEAAERIAVELRR